MLPNHIRASYPGSALNSFPTHDLMKASTTVAALAQTVSSTLSPNNVSSLFSNATDLILACNTVNNLPAAKRCEFTRNFEENDCEDDLAYIQYVPFIYCSFGDEGRIGAVILCFIWMLILFIAIGITATDFLCPALFLISKSLGLSQNVAGVTLLAFGNGSPDIFAAIAGIRGGRPNMVVGGLYGVGTYVTMLCAGTIFLLKGFKVLASTFIRDVLFYLAGVTWVIYLYIVVGEIRMWDAIGFILLYLGYVAVVIAGKYLDKSQKNSPPLVLHGHGPSTDEEEGTGIVFEGIQVDDDPTAGNVVMKGFLFLDEDYFLRKKEEEENRKRERGEIRNKNLTLPHLLAKRPSKVSLTLPPPEELMSTQNKLNNINFDSESNDNNNNDSPDDNSLYATVTSLSDLWKRVRGDNGQVNNDDTIGPHSKRSSVFSISRQQLLNVKRNSAKELKRASRDIIGGIAPIDLGGWKHQNWGGKSCEIVKSPIRFFLLLTTPMADLDTKNRKWNKPLSCLHCITGPVFVSVAIKAALETKVGPIPLPVIILIVAAIISLAMVLTSSYEVQPRYYRTFSSYLGFAVSITWIFLISNEVIATLRSVGIALNLSEEFLGMTLLAWGNGLLDMFSNISVARKGFPRMAIAACFGGPLMSLLIGTGIPALSNHISGEKVPIKLELNWHQPLPCIIYAVLAGGLFSTLVVITACRFTVKRFWGGILVSVYGCFIIVAFLTEFNAIPWP